MMGSRFCVRSHRKQITSHQARHKASQEGKSLIILSEGGKRDGVIYNCRIRHTPFVCWQAAASRPLLLTLQLQMSLNSSNHHCIIQATTDLLRNITGKYR